MRPKIFALISTYREREILPSCVASARHLDRVIVFEGAVGTPEGDLPSPLFQEEAKELKNFLTGGAIYPTLNTYQGRWESDAGKRTAMLRLAEAIDKDAWILWLDGDEILLWGEYLRDHCQRADNETATGGTTIRLVEYDGSVVSCYGKLIKAASVSRYLMSSYEVELANGMTVALPNVPICTAGGIPYATDDPITSPNDERLATLRPPLAGEPHLLHRHGLRDPKRTAQRLHNAESDSFAEMVKEAGLEGVDNQTAERN